MSQILSRRALLSGAAAGLAGAALPPALPAPADPVSPAERGWIMLRRDIHRHPEAPGQEKRTAAVVAHRLRAAGLAVTTGVGGHGVVGVLTGSRPGRTVAYRADMDAVPPKDQVMGGAEPAHFCGHDLHTTIGVGLAETLASRRSRLGGRVVFLFQPAEESLTGAAAMLGDGVLDGRVVGEGIRPEEIHALHCGPFPLGQIAISTGLPGQDQAVITTSGAEPAQQLAAAINALSTVSRPAGPADLDRLVTDLQTPGGPLTAFVFVQARAVGAEVQVSARCWPEHRYVEVRADIQRLAAGATVTFRGDPFPAMICPEPESRALERHLRRTIGAGQARRLHAAIPYNGEDFALFLDRLPGTYSLLGVRSPGAGIATSYPHYGTFTPDERAIGLGVRAMTGWLTARTQRR